MRIARAPDVRLAICRGPGCARMPRGTLPALEGLGKRLRPPGLEVQVVVGDEALLRRLNREFRARDRGTDVLSFVYDKPHGRPRPPRSGRAPGQGRAGPDAEIYVSLPRARTQARERGHSVAAELVVLVLHGLLHVQGHDHRRSAPARRMRAAEAGHVAWLRRRWPQLTLEPLLPGAAAPPRRSAR